ncbi:YfdQ family protein [Williamsia herbipolensis]|uniref:YfdQ family protein n=1 Tax=Williamsia herbipolensis TaxID=1603258 RepID=A0AAU4K016_9NOCA|nr:DUF2303 family protein [Williamsia herbipolensis]
MAIPQNPEIDIPVDVDLNALGFGRDQNPVLVVDTNLDDVTVAVGVTAEKGLQVEVIDLRNITDAAEGADPIRVRDTRIVADVESFLGELARRPLIEGSSTLWGSVAQSRILAIYDDHGVTTPGHRADRLMLQLKRDADWVAWHELSDKFLAQEEFGNRLEDLLHTVTDPEQAELLEIADSIRASTSGEFESSISRSDGALSAVYRTEVNARAGRSGTLEVPQHITLELRPWEGHPETYTVRAAFRLRVQEGTLKLGVKLQPTRTTELQAWRDLTTRITNEVAVPVYASGVSL